MLNEELWLKQLLFTAIFVPGNWVGYKASRCILELFGCLGKNHRKPTTLFVKRCLRIDGVQFVHCVLWQ